MNANFHPDAFISFLLDNGIKQGYFIFKDGQLQASHQTLNPLKAEIETWPDFLEHEGIFFEIDAETNSLFTVFVHNTVRGQSSGGVRFKSYDTVAALFQDGLRLAKGMADKNAVARLWWGGGKAIIYRKEVYDVSDELRHRIYDGFGTFMAQLNGIYITAEDMNTREKDMISIYEKCRFTTCIPEAYGGSSNPSTYTAKGVFSGIKAAAEFKYGKDQPLRGKTALLQGAGNVGFHVMELLVAAGAKVFVYDTNSKTPEKIRKQFTTDQVEIVANGKALFEMKAHILSPNAIGAILHDESIANLKVDIIAGGANNQLLDPVKHSKALHEKGILYLPDFFINRLGIINCANEQYGYVRNDIEQEVELVYTDSLDLLERAAKQDCSPQEIAAEIAAERMKLAHPIWGHRGPRLVAEAIGNGFGK